MSIHKIKNNFNLKCIQCKKWKNNVRLRGKAKGCCSSCYKKLFWKPKLVKCERCERMLPMHAKGFCTGCYNSTFHIDKVKVLNAKYAHNINKETYKKLVEKCMICDFDKIVEIHHLDHDHKNTSQTNLVGPCPNHHRMIHSKRYQPELFNLLKGKGFKIPVPHYKTDNFFNNPRIRKHQIQAEI